MNATATRRVLSGPRKAPKLSDEVFPLNSGDLLSFAIGTTVFRPIHLIGDVPFGEFILLLAIPFLLRKHPDVLLRPGTRRIFILMGIWIFSQIISDVANGSAMDDRLKGIARVVFFALDLVGLTILVGKSLKRTVVVALGLALSEVLGLWVNGIRGADAWKFGGAIAASMLATMIGSYLILRRRFLAYLLLMAFLAACNLHYGYRSQIAIDLVTVVFSISFSSLVGKGRRVGDRGVGLPFSSAVARGQGAGKRIVNLTPSVAAARKRGAGSKGILRFATLLLFSLGALWLSQKIIHEAVKSSYFDSSIEQKFQSQASGQMGVLFGARPEIPVAIQAIKDAPLLGHGSYAVGFKYAVLLQDYQFKYGYTDSDEPIEVGTGGIPTHSHLTASWVDGGVFASLIWFYLLWLIMRAIKVVSDTRPLLAPFYAYLFVTFFWDILFSPFGYDRRIYESFFIVLLVNLTTSPTVVSASRRLYPRTRPHQKRIYRGTPSRPAFSRLPRPDTVR